MKLSECKLGEVVCEYKNDTKDSVKYAFEGSSSEYLMIGHIIGFKVTLVHPTKIMVEVKWCDDEIELIEPEYLTRPDQSVINS